MKEAAEELTLATEMLQVYFPKEARPALQMFKSAIYKVAFRLAELAWFQNAVEIAKGEEE